MKKIISYIFLTLTLILGCAFAVQAAETEHKPADIPGLTFDHSMDLSYAKEFNVDYYNDGYALLTIDQEGQFLVVPECDILINLFPCHHRFNSFFPVRSLNTRKFRIST